MNQNRPQNNRRNFLSKMLITGASGLALLTTSTYAKGRRRSSTPVLTTEQLDELFFIYQEEKVARDVYITLGKLYPAENTFASIQLSEQRHLDSARALCDKYNIDLSGVNEDEVGNFVLPVLQDLYDTCVGLGEESLFDALKVGELIEVTDIKDLDHILDDLDMPDDVERAFESLREGSYNHLESFQVAISREQS